MDRSMFESPIRSLNSIDITSASPFQSPFLQVDPSLAKSSLKLSPEFIFPDGTNKSSRGRFEMAFSQIGGSIMTGAFIGGTLGTFKGLREVSTMNDSLSIKRSHLLNYITRNGASMANTFGTIALLYSAIGVGLSFIQDENDDLNTLIAASTTGTIYGALSKSKAMENVQGTALNIVRAKRAGMGLTIGVLAASSMIFLLKNNSNNYK